MEGLPSYVEAAKGQFDEPAQVIEDGLEFQAPLAEGQKTGWFFDQAANRRALPKYVRKGARVLDVFSYVGAWGVRAAHGGAREVLCVDSSAAALELAASKCRAQRRQAARRAKAMPSMCSRIWPRKAARFDVVIIDPPAFAKRKKDLPKALAAYKRLNQLALRVIADDGILVSCSCSHHVSAEELQDAIAKAARGGGQASANPGNGRPGARPSGASGHSRDPVSESLFLSGQ